MGNNLSPFHSANQQGSLEFYSTVNDPNVGECQVYSVQHLPMCYVLKVKRKSSSIHSVFRGIQNHQSRALLSMYAFVKVNYCDCKDVVGEGIVMYWQYFNFYLEDMLERRVGKGKEFGEEEIWHFVQVCVEGYSVFKKHSIYYSFSPETIALTPEGKLKIFWANIQESNSHLPYFEFFAGQGSEYRLSYYSPEELESMRSKHRNPNLNFQKCNMYSFGLLLLYMSTLYNPNKLYHNHFHLDLQTIQLLVDSVGARYSKDIWLLLIGCLDLNPLSRLSFDQIRQRFKGRMKDQYSILVHQKEIIHDPDEEKKLRTRRISLKKKSL